MASDPRSVPKKDLPRDKYEPAEQPYRASKKYFRDRKVSFADALSGLDDNLDSLSPKTQGAIRNMNLAFYYLLEAVYNLSSDVALLHRRLENLQREVDSLPRHKHR